MLFQGIDLSEIINIYPSVVVKHGDEITTISFEWFDENSASVERLGYALIFLDSGGQKKEIFFNTYAEIMDAMQELSTLLKK